MFCKRIESNELYIYQSSLSHGKIGAAYIDTQEEILSGQKLDTHQCLYRYRLTGTGGTDRYRLIRENGHRYRSDRYRLFCVKCSPVPVMTGYLGHR